MVTRSRLLVPVVLALAIGASVPAVADDTPVSTDSLAEATAEARAEPLAETADEPTVEPSASPSASPSARPVEDPAPESPPMAAAAVSGNVTTGPEFTAALSTCEADDVVTLGADFTVSGRTTAACDLTIDLAGHQLVTGGVDIAWERHLTIDDSARGGRLVATGSGSFRAGIRTSHARLTINGGRVEASGSSYGAGIGGGESDPGDTQSSGANGTTIINGGHVVATGGYFAAGIGGAGWGYGGTVAVNGGTVNASGGEMGSGIGGGYARNSTSIVINGGTVSATARDSATALGMGGDSNWVATPIAIGADADVTVAAAPGRSVISGPNARTTVDGTVHVQEGALDGLIGIGASGSISGPADRPVDGVPVLAGAAIINDGVLIASSVADGGRVLGHHHRLSFDSAGAGTIGPITIYAPTVAAGLKTLPTVSRTGLSFLGWKRAGAAVESDTDLGAGSTDGQPVTVTLTAAWGILTPADLNASLDTCPDETVALAADVTVNAAVTVNCDVTLDLAGHDLAAAGVIIATDRTFTIDDSDGEGTLTTSPSSGAGIRTTGAAVVIDGGTINASGGGYSAGIGGAQNTPAGAATINGGTIKANGGYPGAAGIGGAHGGTTAGTITINGGMVTARSSTNGSGIGAGSGGSAGTITINGGEVQATALEYGGAGIGTGWLGNGGTVLITGGTVRATGADQGPGIGSGIDAEAATDVRLTGGTITANGGSGSPGIGLGEYDSGTSSATDLAMDIETGVDADVTVKAGKGASSVLGSASSTRDTATIQIDGTVKVPSGTLDTTRNDLTIGSTGRLIGTTAEPTTGASITGSGEISNDGIIALTDVADTTDVTGRHYEVVTSTGTVKVYGPSVRVGYRAMPSDPTRGVDVFTGWTLDGDPFTATTSLPGTSSDGTAVRIDLTAAWSEGMAAFDRSTVTLTAGDLVAVNLALTDGDGDPVPVDPADWDITAPNGITLEHSSDGWELTSTTAGTGTVTAVTTAGGITYSTSLKVTVKAAAVASLVVSHTGIAAQGETITLTADGADAFRNDLGEVTSDVTFTSSNTSDVIDANEITFTQSGPRTITATHANGTISETLVTVSVTLGPATEMTLDSTGTAAQGETLTVTADATDRFGNDLGDVTSDVTFTSSNATDVIDANEISFTASGGRILTATHANGTTETLTVDVAVTLGPVTEMALGYTGTARESGTITLTADGSDRFGNDRGDVTDEVTFTSSVATDIIDGDQVTFPHASPHTITATHANGTTETLLIEVKALPAEGGAKASEDEAELADSGSSMSAWWLVFGLALLFGGGRLVARVRRR